MEKTHALRLLEYDFWANNQLFEVIAKSETALPEDLEDILSHIFGAKEIWLKRILSEPALGDLFNRKNIKMLDQLNNRLYSDWKNLLYSNSTEQIISYSNLSGETFQTPLFDIITHVVNHGSYHRGQVAKTLRKTGTTPPSTDFIVFSRL